MRQLYPDIKPNKTHHIKVAEPHVLYVEESGNPDGIPVLFVHGGPGAGCENYHRRFFDPNIYNVPAYKALLWECQDKQIVHL